MSPAPYTREAGRQLFYCNGKIATELNGDARWRLLQADGLVLAQQNHRSSGLPSMLAACDQQRSVLSIYERKRQEAQAYSPYGHHIQGSGLPSLLAFNGERPDAITGRYHLGNGYRQFSPVMMRFCSPDSWSPFGAGGFNAYVYCAGDPTNRTDPTGHFWGIGTFFRGILGKKSKAPKQAKIGVPVTKTNPTPDNRTNSISQKIAPTADGINPFEQLTDLEINQQLELLNQFGAKRESSRQASSSVRPESSLVGSAPTPRPKTTLMERRRAQENLNRERAIERDTDLLQVLSKIQEAGQGTDEIVAEIGRLQKNIRQWVGN
ncbi:RHS repeat-associated core domain-containing protein [Pseudomonas juntendi]|uniref:RHS repeat-associated core domain-containing protein n=1 Tax=Pseudomonas juntendi TaxID=2666183 RepID=UPI0018D8CFE7|nr:RHS repeat-associated core domain-containing protein [Pseudomonas juntendi]MBH3384923.1 RHS repeat-associated core domain-containing protein [Pseudomonas juntendi]